MKYKPFFVAINIFLILATFMLYFDLHPRLWHYYVSEEKVYRLDLLQMMGVVDNYIIAFMLAMLGNAFVFFANIFSKTK